jgi:hypothetical protein
MLHIPPTIIHVAQVVDIEKAEPRLVDMAISFADTEGSCNILWFASPFQQSFTDGDNGAGRVNQAHCLYGDEIRYAKCEH